MGTATAAAAGSIYGLLYPFNSGSHYDLISRLLSIVLLGGLGSIGGAVIGSLIVSTSSAVVAATMLVVVRLLALSPWLALRFRLPLIAAGAVAAAAIGYTLLTRSL